MMWKSIIAIAALVTLSSAQEVKNEADFIKQCQGTIKNGPAPVDGPAAALAWKTRFAAFKKQLKDSPTTMTNFQNADGVFGSKMAPLNWWAEFDGPQSDQSIKAGQAGFRGTNRYVVLLNAQPTDANKATMKILKVFMTNDHYTHKHEIKNFAVLGGLDGFGAHRSGYNMYRSAYAPAPVPAPAPGVPAPKPAPAPVGYSAASGYAYPEQQGMEMQYVAMWTGLGMMMLAMMACVCIGICVAGAVCGAFVYKITMEPSRRPTVAKYEDLEAGQ